MAEGLLAVGANACLSTLIGTYDWMKLHVGAPGSAGTSNPASETTRKQISFATPSGGSVASDADATWTSVAGTEDYSQFSMLDASTAGTPAFTGAITANSVTAGDTFTIASGDWTASFTLAS